MLQNDSKSAYVAAVRYGKKFLDRCCSHMLTTKELTTYWTKPMVIKEALKYHQINHFKTNSPQAYNKSRKFGKYFHKKNCSHMKLKYKKWNKRKIRQTLLNYKSLKEAKLNNQDALDSAKHRGSVFYKKVTKHLKKEVLPQEKDYVENCLIPLLHSILKKHKQIYNITHEAHFKHNNKHYFIDILIIFPKHNKIIPIEFKHTDKQWQLKSIKSQIQKYNNYFLKSHKSTVFLLSQNGKYGISEKDFIQILILFIRTNRLKKPIYNFDKK